MFFSLFSACKNCKNNEEVGEEKICKEQIINMDGKFSWKYADCDELETEQDFLELKNSNDFIPFENKGKSNLAKLVGDSGNYIWLRAEFEIPESLKGKNLGLVIPYLHFSEKLYLNDKFIWSYGSFPPNEQNALYESHYYYFPLEYLNQDGKNTILIKVYCLCRAMMSDGVFISEYSTAEEKSEKYTFWFSKMYVFFEGGLFCAALLFFLLFIQQRENLVYHDFSVMNFFTLIFLTQFFATELPWFMNYKISYLLFTKFIICIPPIFVMYFLASFITHFIEFKQPLWLIILRVVLLFIPVIIIIRCSTYKSLMRVCPIIVTFLLFHIAFAFLFMSISFIRDKKHKLCHIVTLTFLPFVFSVVLDFILRYSQQKILFPYFSIIGWNTMVIGFVIVLTVNFTQISKRNEYLNDNLQKEVEVETEKYVKVQTKLEEEIERSNQDLKMASIVQNKYFPPTDVMPRGWQISVLYKPLSTISGDLYDYYQDNERNLEGVALFDVSGHALASGLITMLAKNIIAHNFERAKGSNEKLNVTLSKINDIICREKGDIQNYLTGILIKFSKISPKNTCQVALSNASHPYPLLYHASTGIVEQIGVSNRDEQFGVIGMKNMPVSFLQFDFVMEQNDILLLYTDGLTEAINEKFEQFGSERVSELLSKYHLKPAKEIQQEILSALSEFTKNKSFQDDITIVVLKRDDIEDFVEELEEV